jgi:hypothetical protein
VNVVAPKRKQDSASKGDTTTYVFDKMGRPKAVEEIKGLEAKGLRIDDTTGDGRFAPFTM